MSDPAYSLIGEERMMPEQWHSRTAERFPEHRLLIAVFEDACAMLLRPIESQAARDARAWFENPDPGRISLRYLCEHLGLDVAYVRRGAAMVVGKQVRIPRRAHTSTGNGRARISVNERIRG